MAQVVNYYKTYALYTHYLFKTATNQRGDVTLDIGAEIRLPANYEERITNGRLPTIYPYNEYWVEYWVTGDKTPVYKTVTDACTLPEQLMIEGQTLTITGGGGGDLNEFTGFGVSWCERDITGTEWGMWSAETVTAARTLKVTANAGKLRKYRARTTGTAGESFYSEYMVCETLVSGNTTNTPVIMLPTNGAVTVSKTPVIVVSCNADAEGDEMTLKRSINGGEWMTVAAVAAEGGTVYDRLPEMKNERHTLQYKLTDSNNEESDTVSVTIEVAHTEWRRSIASGDIISNHEISHVADINEMLLAVNIQRLYYGLEAIALPGYIGRFKDWGAQMICMLDATRGSLIAAGQLPVYTRPENGWPNAATINEIRNRVMMV